MLSLLAALPLLPALVSGCRPGEHPMMQRRNLGVHDPARFARDLEHRQLGEGTGAPTYANPSTYSLINQVSGNTDPQQECAGYFYPPATAMKASYPEVWQTAYIMDGDETATALFNQINQSTWEKFPHDLPKGTGHMGNWTGVNYNYTDPDCWWTWKGCTTPPPWTGLPADITTTPEPNTWGYAFDDGPNCSHNALYDFLQQQKQTATMFYIGSNVVDWTLQALRGVQDGHEICVHTWSHQYMTSFDNMNAFSELYYARKAIQDLLGITPRCWRPPYGDVDNRIRYIAQQLNLTTIVWEYDTQDWREGAPMAAGGVTAQQVTTNYDNIVAAAKNGSFATGGPLVLNHELTNFTMQEMMDQYSNIQGAFSHMVPICVAYNLTQPYAESEYVCPTFESYIAGNIKISNQTVNEVTSSSTTSGGPTGTAASSFSMTGSQTGKVASQTGSTSKSSAASSVLDKGLAQLAAVVLGVGMGALLL